MPTGHYERTEEHRRKISEGNKGKKVSNETRKRMSQASKKRMTKEARLHLSLLHKKNGIKPPLVKGKAHYNWKGGITPLTKKIRQSTKYTTWRTQIFIRDSYLCVLCGLGGELNADHYPTPFSVIFHKEKISSLKDSEKCKKLWDINNGRTLCIKCHRKTDTYAKNYKGEKIKTDKVIS